MPRAGVGAQLLFRFLDRRKCEQNVIDLRDAKHIGVRPVARAVRLLLSEMNKVLLIFSADIFQNVAAVPYQPHW